MSLKKLKKVMQLMLIMVLSIGLVGCGNSKTKKADDNTSSKAVEEKTSTDEETKNLPVATISVEGFGDIEVELYPEIAPNTVNNFISLANSGFYDNLTFHRVVKGFMIQGGDPEGKGTGGPGYAIEGEFTSNGFANSLKHTEGVISMARSKNPDSAGSQFFIMTAESSNLDGEYAAFGKVISGMDVVHKIEEVKTEAALSTERSTPKEKVTIKSIKVDTKGIEYKEPEKK